MEEGKRTNPGARYRVVPPPGCAHKRRGGTGNGDRRQRRDLADAGGRLLGERGVCGRVVRQDDGDVPASEAGEGARGHGTCLKDKEKTETYPFHKDNPEVHTFLDHAAEGGRYPVADEGGGSEVFVEMLLTE